MTTFNPAPVTSYMCNVSQGQNQANQHTSYLSRLKKTAIMQLTGGCVLVLLGIVTISIKAFWSVYATALWSGILIFGLTGVIGIMAASKNTQPLVRAYMGLSIVGCAMAIALFVMHIIAPLNEPLGGYFYGEYYPRLCAPDGYYWGAEPCGTSAGARQAMNALIAVDGFFLIVVCSLSASFGCCASWPGCESCCKKCCNDCGGCDQCCAQSQSPQSAPTTFQLQPVQGMTVSTAGNQQVPDQAGMFIVQQGPSPAMPAPGSTNQGQPSYILVPAANQMQPQQPSNLVAPPTYYVAGPGHAQFPPVEQHHNDAKE